jgi:TolB-like protein
MRNIREIMEDRKGEKPSTIVVQLKGHAAISAEVAKQSKRGYTLESTVPQGRKRVILTFRLGD